jgi:hypothetical protein
MIDALRGKGQLHPDLRWGPGEPGVTKAARPFIKTFVTLSGVCSLPFNRFSAMKTLNGQSSLLWLRRTPMTRDSIGLAIRGAKPMLSTSDDREQVTPASAC